MENRHGLAVEATLTHATGTAEREATLVMLDRRTRKPGITLGADKAYDVTDFVGDLRARGATPHIAVNGTVSKLGVVRKTAIDEATTSHPGYAISQRCRKRIDLRRKNGLPDRFLIHLTSAGSKKQRASHPSKFAANQKWMPPSPSP